MNKFSIKLLREIRKIFFRNIRILSKIKNIKLLKVNAKINFLAKIKKKLAAFLTVSLLEITNTSEIEIIKLWIMKLKKNAFQGKEVKLVYNNNWKELMENLIKTIIKIKKMVFLYSTKVIFKKYRKNIFARSLLGMTSKRRDKSVVIIYSVNEETYWYTKESTQEKSRTHAISAAWYLQQLETETTTREDILTTNLTFAILLITAQQNITENISSSIIFSTSINLWTSISQILTKSSQKIMTIILWMMARSARIKMIWNICRKMIKYWMGLSQKVLEILMMVQTKNVIMMKITRLLVKMASFVEKKELTKLKIQKYCRYKDSKEKT